MQLAVIEFARQVAELPGATSEEFLPEAEHPVIYLMREWYDYRTDAIIRRDGPRTRAAPCAWELPCVLTADTLAGVAYGEAKIMERHRHRMNSTTATGTTAECRLVISGTSPNGELVEIIELGTIPGSWDASSIRNSSPGP